MKRVALTVVATIAGLVLLLQFKTQPAGAGRVAALAPSAAGSPSVAASPGPTPTRSPHRRHRTQPSASSSSSPSSGTRSAVGQTINTRYGPVQVKVTEVAGRITNVTPVQLPSQDSHSQSIAAYAAPKLRQEAIAAGSARIDFVSGATYTSDGYAQSLQSALDNLHG
jgi:uncharacterized protein with FMN-binding domain